MQKVSKKTDKSCSCPYCDIPVKPTSSPFCKGCGAKLRFCSKCGCVIPKDAQKCPKCGAE